MKSKSVAIRCIRYSGSQSVWSKPYLCLLKGLNRIPSVHAKQVGRFPSFNRHKLKQLAWQHLQLKKTFPIFFQNFLSRTELMLNLTFDIALTYHKYYLTYRLMVSFFYITHGLRHHSLEKKGEKTFRNIVELSHAKNVRRDL